MKITEERLQQIINEEITSFRSSDFNLADFQALYEKLGAEVLLEQIKQKLPPKQLTEIIKSISKENEVRVIRENVGVKVRHLKG